MIYRFVANAADSARAIAAQLDPTGWRFLYLDLVLHLPLNDRQFQHAPSFEKAGCSSMAETR